MNYLGEYLDIHCGAEDAIFPHHTNEIAQSEAYLHHKWCNYWIHMAFLNDESGKMSKSNGEFLTLGLLKEKGYNPLSYRFMCLLSHYHKNLVFTYESLDQADNAYKKLKKRISELKDDGNINNEMFELYNNKFKDELNNNLNTANTITLIYDILKETNINEKTKLELIKEFDKVLSLDLTKNDKKEIGINEEEINRLIHERNEAKANKDYALADEIRNKLLSMGILLKDTREGTTYEIVK